MFPCAAKFFPTTWPAQAKHSLPVYDAARPRASTIPTCRWEASLSDCRRRFTTSFGKTPRRSIARAFGRGVAQILSSRHGGSEDAWMRAHDVAGAWYSDVLKEPETWSRGTWLEVVNRADAENLVRMFREVGIAPLQDPLAAARALEFEVMSAIDSAFPDARPAVARLRRDGHRVYVTTNADRKS